MMDKIEKQLVKYYKGQDPNVCQSCGGVGKNHTCDTCYENGSAVAAMGCHSEAMDNFFNIME